MCVCEKLEYSKYICGTDARRLQATTNADMKNEQNCWNGCNKNRLMRDAKNIKMHYACIAFNIRRGVFFSRALSLSLFLIFQSYMCGVWLCSCSCSCSHWLIYVNHIETHSRILHNIYKYSWQQMKMYIYAEEKALLHLKATHSEWTHL